MVLADVVSTAPNGRVMVRAEGRLVVLPTGCAVRPMSALARTLAGALTPGLTTPSGITLSEPLLPWLTVETVCHETVHWWQANRRMGAVSYVATYAWQALLHASSGQWHETHPMEVEARRCGQALAALPQGVIDVEAWVVEHLPATR